MTERLGRKHYPAGSVIFSQGDAGHSAFLIADGLVEIADGANGIVRARIGPGELIDQFDANRRCRGFCLLALFRARIAERLVLSFIFLHPFSFDALP
jgi:hypothetical protein